MTEEVWSWWQEGSVHRAPWPTTDELSAATGDPAVLAAASVALTALRKAKSEQKLSMRAELDSARVAGPADEVARVEAAADDLRAAGNVLGALTFDPDETGSLTVAVALPGMTVIARAFDDAEEFAAASGEFVRADPARSTVLATVLEDVLAGFRTYPGSTWVLAEESGVVVGVAMQTPPHRLWLSAMPDAAARAVVEVMADRAAPRALPGISGSRVAAGVAAHAWQELRPAEQLIEVRALRSYTLGQLRPPSAVPGAARLATPPDVPLLHAWQVAFGEEVDLAVVDFVAATAARLAGHGAYHVWEDSGSVVSIAGHSAPVSGMVRVGPVYTPPERRRRGYGGAVTAATTQHALDGGAAQVTLFTDLANPTSNSIYQQLGYQPVDDFVELDLV